MPAEPPRRYLWEQVGRKQQGAEPAVGELVLDLRRSGHICGRRRRRRQEVLGARPRPAGTHEEPARLLGLCPAPWRSILPRPGPPPCILPTPAAHLAHRAHGLQVLCPEPTRPQPLQVDLSEVPVDLTPRPSRQQNPRRSGTPRATLSPLGTVHTRTRKDSQVVLPNCLPGEAGLSLSSLQMHSELMLVLPMAGSGSWFFREQAVLPDSIV